MRATPALQLGDMLAWANNREAILAQEYMHVALMTMRRVMPTKWIKWGERELKRKYQPLIYKVDFR
jgi:hypothetical protein